MDVFKDVDQSVQLLLLTRTFYKFQTLVIMNINNIGKIHAGSPIFKGKTQWQLNVKHWSLVIIVSWMLDNT